MLIDSLSLENYRCFDKLSIDFDPRLTVLVGANGSGKTCVLGALLPLLEYTASHFKSRLPGGDRVSGGNLNFQTEDLPLGHESDTIKVSYSVNGHDLSQNITVPHHKSNFFDSNSEALTDYGKFVLASEIKSNPIFVYYPSHRGIPTQHIKLHPSTLPPRSVYAYVNITNGHLDFENFISWFEETNSQEGIQVRDSGDIHFRLPELEYLRKALSTMLLEEYGEPNFKYDTKEITLINMESKIPIPISHLSQGFQSIFLLTIDLLFRMILANQNTDFGSDNVLHTPGVVLIDDVELHLHPAWQQKFFSILMEVFPKIQFIVTTHSPLMLRARKEITSLN
jgi:predicted ATP-binding protein involved in virulence